MSEFSGTLNIMSDISRLDGDLLLKVGIPDETQAKFAATSFLEADRHLHSNDSIVVTGERVSAGKIRMSDARAAATEELLALNAGGHGNAAAITAKTKRKKKASKKVTEGK